MKLIILILLCIYSFLFSYRVFFSTPAHGQIHRPVKGYLPLTSGSPGMVLWLNAKNEYEWIDAELAAKRIRERSLSNEKHQDTHH